MRGTPKVVEIKNKKRAIPRDRPFLLLFNSDAAVHGLDLDIGARAAVDVSAEGFANATFDGDREVCMDAAVSGLYLEIGLKV